VLRPPPPPKKNGRAFQQFYYFIFFIFLNCVSLKLRNMTLCYVRSVCKKMTSYVEVMSVGLSLTKYQSGQIYLNTIRETFTSKYVAKYWHLALLSQT
jgi:hypothetical protein